MEYWYVYLIPGVVATVWMAWLYAIRIPGLWLSTDQFNSTKSWTPAAPHEQRHVPPEANGLERGLGIITPRLEEGETLEGFAFGALFPPRPQDWGPTVGISKNPILLAVTSRRMMLFHLKFYPQVVLSSCSIRYDAIQYLRPPKRGHWGTSGRLRFGLFSGLEYQLTFLGPIIYPEFLEQEQRMAAYLRWLAPRYPTSRPTEGVEPRKAA